MLCYICYLSALWKLTLFDSYVCQRSKREAFLPTFSATLIYVYIVISQTFKTMAVGCERMSTLTLEPASMTGRLIFYMFIHFNSIACVLLKSWWEANINPLRQGTGRLGKGRHSIVSCRPSFIIICSSVSLCLLALSPSISILSLMLTRRGPFALRCTSHFYFFCCCHPHLQSLVCRYICQRVPMLFLPLKSNLSR